MMEKEKEQETSREEWKTMPLRDTRGWRGQQWEFNEMSVLKWVIFVKELDYDKKQKKKKKDLMNKINWRTDLEGSFISFETQLKKKKTHKYDELKKAFDPTINANKVV